MRVEKGAKSFNQFLGWVIMAQHLPYDVTTNKIHEDVNGKYDKIIFTQKSIKFFQKHDFFRYYK